MKRIQQFDIAKGIGIILVVLGHSTIEMGHYLIYMFHMPLFFYLSGIFHRYDSFVNQLVNKINRLLVPFVVFLCILLFFNAICGLDNGGGYLRPPHLRGIIGPLWFLPSLFTVSILYNCIRPFRPIIILVICMAIAFFCGYLPDRLGWNNYFYLFSSCSCLIFYCLGNLFGRKITSINKCWGWVTMIINIGLFVMIYLIAYKRMHFSIQDIFMNKHPENFIVWLSQSLIGIMMISSLSLLIDSNNPVARLLAYLGECSLYIFAFHYAILTIIHRIIPNPTFGVELFIIIFAISIGCIIRLPFRKIVPAVFK